MFIPNSSRKRFPYRGATSSSELNDLTDNLVSDIHGLNNQLVSTENRLESVVKILVDENRFLKSQLASIRRSKADESLVRARNGLRVTHSQSMYDLSNVKFFSVANLRPHIDSLYGVATLPSNAIESKFTRTSIYDGGSIVPLSLTVSTTSLFADENTSLPTEHEVDAASVDEGEPSNAFNGVNSSWWIRSVEYPLDSDVNEVQVELIVNVPSQNNIQSNVFTIHPYPVGTVDIMDISFSSDLAGSFYKIPHRDAPTIVNPLTSSTEKIFIFPPRDIDQIRIRLRQRHFIEENGKKVFRYGLQEVGLYLVDFEKTNSSTDFSSWIQQTNSENISMCHEIKAPEGFFFNAINHFSSDPDFTLEDSANRHIVYRIYDDDPTQSAGLEIWNSTNTLPQNMPSTLGSQLAIAGNITSLFVVTSMRFVETIGGSNSPYRANTPPYVNGFTIEYSASPAF